MKVKEEFAKYFNTESLAEVITQKLGHAILTDTQPKSQEINGDMVKNRIKLAVNYSNY